MKKTLAQIIKENREKLGLTQRALATLADVDYTYIGKIETGERKKPSLEILSKLSKALNIDIIDILKGSSYTENEINGLIYLSKKLNVEVMHELLKRNISPDIMEQCLSNDGIQVYYDVSKVLNLYKKNKINEAQVLALISLCEEITTVDFIGYKTENGIIQI